MATASDNLSMLMGAALLRLSWREVEELAGFPPGTVRHSFSKIVSKVARFKGQAFVRRYVETRPKLGPQGRIEESTKFDVKTGKIPDYNSPQARILGQMLQYFQNGGEGVDDDSYLTQWLEVAHNLSKLAKELKIPPIVADPYKIHVTGGVLTTVFAERSILGHDGAAIGLVVPSNVTEREMGRIEQVMSTQSPPQYGKLLAHLATLTTEMVRPDTMKLLFEVTPTNTHKPVSLLGNDRIRNEREHLDFMMARRQALKPRLGESGKMAVFIRHYQDLMRKATEVLMKLQTGPWTLWTRNGKGGYTRFTRTSLDKLKKSYDLPAGNRFRLIATAGNPPDSPEVTKAKFIDVSQMFYIYQDYVIRSAPLSYYERQQMIDALRTMMAKLREYNMFIRSVDATIVTVDVNEDGEVASNQINSKSLPITIDRFEDWVVITIEQLTAPTAKGLMLMQASREAERAVLKDYFSQQMGDREVPYINPFRFNVTYTFPMFTGAAHKAEANKHYRYLTLACSESEAGECFEKALVYASPKPTEIELELFRQARLIGNRPMDYHLSPIRSIPCIIVRSPRKNGEWTVIATNRPELKNKNPQEIDPTSTCVMCIVGEHMYRVTGISEPQGNKPLSERIYRSGMYTLHRPDSVEAYRHLAILTDSMQPARFSKAALAPLLKTENLNEVFRLMGGLTYMPLVRAAAGPEGLGEFDKYKLGVKDIVVVDPKLDEFVVLRSTCPNVKFEDIMAKPERYVVVAQFMDAYCSVIEFHTWTVQDGMRVYMTARDQFDVSRGETWADTVKLMNIDEDQKAILKSPNDLHSLTIDWFVIVDVFRNEEVEDFKFWNSAKRVTQQMIESEATLKLWRDEDGTFFVIVGDKPYATPAPKLKKLDPIVFAFDAETGNKNMFAKKAHTTPIIFHACLANSANGPRTRARFEGKKSSFGMVDWIVDNLGKIHKDRKLVGFGFNNCNFDNYGCLPAIAMNKRLRFGFGTKGSKIVLAGSKLLEIAHENLVIHDIRRFCAGSLDYVSRSLKCKATKTGWDHEYSQQIFDECGGKAEAFLERLKKMRAIDLMRAEDKPRLTQELLGKNAYDAYHEYCANDCEVTLEVAFKLREAYLQITHGKLDIFEFMTLPQAMYSYITSYQAEAGIKLYKCKTHIEYGMCQEAILAGTSRVYLTAPRGMVKKKLGDDDARSQYPHDMHQAAFVVECEPRRVRAIDYPVEECRFYREPGVSTGKVPVYPVTDIVPGMLGIYRIRVTKQPHIEVVPYKGRENELGCHLWDYKGTFEVTCTNIHVINHRYFGGECKVLYGYAYPEARRGVMTKPIEDFKAAKQHQDYIKGLDSEEAKKLGLEFNPVIREAGKGGPNASSGKMVQKPNLDKLTVIADHEKRKEFINRLEDKGRVKNVREVSLTFKEPDDIEAQLGKHDIATAVMYENSLEELFEKSGEPKSIVTGLFIYAWSHHHFLHALKSRAAQAKACWIEETDTLHFDVDKYEDWMWENYPEVNPYDVPAPTKDQLPDPVFDMPLDPENPLLNGRRFGYFYAPQQATDWFKRFPDRWFKYHDEPYVPARELDFGDFTPEAGFTKNGYEPVEVCYIGKKCYYVSKGEDGKEKMRFKGVGRSTREAEELVRFICKYEESQKLLEEKERKDIALDEDYQALLKKTLAGPCILKRSLYETLSSGYAVDACERRFVGGLSFVEDDGCSLHNDLVIKRLAPPGYFHLVVRTDANTEAERQLSTYYPKDGPNITIQHDGTRVSKEHILILLMRLAATKNDSYARRGVTHVINGKTYYINAKTYSFLMRRQNADWIVEHYE